MMRKKSRAPVLYAELVGAQHAFEVFPSERTAHALAGVERFLVWMVARHRTQREALEGAATERAPQIGAAVDMAR